MMFAPGYDAVCTALYSAGRRRYLLRRALRWSALVGAPLAVTLTLTLTLL